MTELTVFQQKISALIPNIDLKMNEPMSRHTSFRIGGGAEIVPYLGHKTCYFRSRNKRAGPR